MKKKINYTDEKISIGERVIDFLPSPADLAKKEETARITINLNKTSIDFFKKEAIKTGVPYQKLIRSVIDIYASYHN
jgi:predicted DNA binding CopG/RHH family protein